MATSVERIKVLNVVEKPSVAKMLVRILSNQYVKELNQSYTFDYQIDDGTDAGTAFQMVVTSVKGYLKEMTFLSNVRSFKSCEPIELFDVNVDKTPKLESQKSTIGHLRRVVEGCKRLYLLLDCDLEGESIAKEVVEVCQEVNSDLLIRRARFSSLHKEYVD
ncbi:putative DNA topoisomerase [Helianthus annuus]|uniref:DNA topoisomerase n=1 Tax=Helianthus annuus TaxID=4232 RepID=A0A9K3IQM5_HELAN|nr:putative DNA topoisomerase [Helianthus annuus]KAJ0559155.1 putative DNA topoisomerase [Helianthus annuus]KAJ0565066.1 putative DNA topoisomerase [Helianthus annuus]KAJ0572096.1 putative DNA topoisomerase [Helianthus annuus]KAJ0739504.1 putative DNA topoisomerase [Helianthus annuus]